MVEYRQRAAATEEQGAPAGPSTDDMPAYQTLAAQYGIEEEMDIGRSNTREQTVEQEYQAYIMAPLSPKNINILKFWEVQWTTDFIACIDKISQVNGATFPTLFQMALDYLPIQASSVPCERIFSSSAETDTKKRNRISPLLMEALQMLKFHLKKEHLNFTQDWVTPVKYMTEDDDEEDLLRQLLQGNSQDSLDRIVQSISSHED